MPQNGAIGGVSMALFSAALSSLRKSELSMVDGMLGGEWGGGGGDRERALVRAVFQPRLHRAPRSSKSPTHHGVSPHQFLSVQARPSTGLAVGTDQGEKVQCHGETFGGGGAF